MYSFKIYGSSLIILFMYSVIISETNGFKKVSQARLRNFLKPTHFRCMNRAFLFIILKIKMTSELFELVV
jgi:hypothetical protein